MVASIFVVRLIQNICDSARPRPVLMLQSHFLRAPPCDCSIGTTIAKVSGGPILDLHRRFRRNGSIAKLERTWRRELPLGSAAIGTAGVSKVGVKIIDTVLNFSDKKHLENRALHPLMSYSVYPIKPIQGNVPSRYLLHFFKLPDLCGVVYTLHTNLIVQSGLDFICCTCPDDWLQL